MQRIKFRKHLQLVFKTGKQIGGEEIGDESRRTDGVDGKLDLVRYGGKELRKFLEGFFQLLQQRFSSDTALAGHHDGFGKPFSGKKAALLKERGDIRPRLAVEKHAKRAFLCLIDTFYTGNGAYPEQILRERTLHIGGKLRDKKNSAVSEIGFFDCGGRTLPAQLKTERHGRIGDNRAKRHDGQDIFINGFFGFGHFAVFVSFRLLDGRQAFFCRQII